MPLFSWLRPAAPARRSLKLQCLEGREVPAAFNITFDYRFDTAGFFNDPARRAILEQAADQYEARLNTTVDLAAITPGNGNSWTATTFNPSNTSQNVSINNLPLAADQIIVFVGGESGVGGGEAGLGGYGGYSASGQQSFFNTLRQRGRSGFAPWGGSMSFSSDSNWYFGTGTPGNTQLDFYSVATHELGHVLGFGVATQWNTLVQGGSYTGANARAVNGGTNPFVSLSNPGHWEQGIKSNGQTVSMEPFISAGTRVAATELDLASLADLGWEVSNINSAPVVAVPPVVPPVVPTVPVAPPTTPVQATPIPTSAQTAIAKRVAIGSDGAFRVYSVANGSLTPIGSPISPFPGFTGTVRTATGDFNNDGVEDIAAAQGPGGLPEVVIYDGATGQESGRFYAYNQGFRGGITLATGNIDGVPGDELLTGADRGGGPHLKIFKGNTPTTLYYEFMAIDDSRFSGGVRVAVADIDGDGFDDVVASAGFGGGPRVAVYSGVTLRAGQAPGRFIGDFLGYGTGVQNGTYVSLADFNNDGHADLVLGAGSGSGHVKVLDLYKSITTGGDPANSNIITQYFVDAPAGYNGGTRVNAGDFDGDGQIETLIGSGTNEFGKVWLRETDGSLKSIALGNGRLSDGVFVG